MNELQRAGILPSEIDEKLFSIDEIRSAFWGQFHERGELFFKYFEGEAKNQASTQSEWDEFAEHLIKHHDNNILKIWTSNNFQGHYPVGTAAIVIANTAEEAASILSSELIKHGLPPAKPGQMEEMEFKHGAFRILCDGDY